MTYWVWVAYWLGSHGLDHHWLPAKWMQHNYICTSLQLHRHFHMCTYVTLWLICMVYLLPASMSPKLNLKSYGCYLSRVTLIAIYVALGYYEDVADALCDNENFDRCHKLIARENQGELQDPSHSRRWQTEPRLSFAGLRSMCNTCVLSNPKWTTCHTK